MDGDLGLWCASAHFCLVSLCLSVPFSPLSFHLHFSFVGRNSRLLTHTIARPFAYESSRGAASEAGKREGRRVIKLLNQSQADIRTLISLMPALLPSWHLFPLGKSFIPQCKKSGVSLLFRFHPFRFYSWTFFCVELFCLTSCQPLAMTLLSSTQDFQTLMAIFRAPYTLLSGIKSINRTDLFRSVEILMRSQMRPVQRVWGG